MLRSLLLVLCLQIPCASELLIPQTDPDFGGYYLDIEKTMQTLNVSRLLAHEIQNQMRDQLENMSHSFSRLTQAAYVDQALTDAIDAVLNRKTNQGRYVPFDFRPGEFVVVLDFDETLGVQWYKHGSLSGVERKGELALTTRDLVPVAVDRKSGNSAEKPEMRMSANTVALRPHIEIFLRRISALSGFKGFILYTAKEDLASWDIIQTWKASDPSLFENFLGFYTRNYLRFDNKLKQASKDLRMFDESLQHVLIVDDNEARVMQKNLNYRLFKFNADGYIDALLASDKPLLSVHSEVLPFVAKKIAQCHYAAQKERQLSFIDCVSKRYSAASRDLKTEWADYREYLQASRKIDPKYLESLDYTKIYHQDWSPALVQPLSEPYPKFRQGRMVD